MRLNPKEFKLNVLDVFGNRHADCNGDFALKFRDPIQKKSTTLKYRTNPIAYNIKKNQQKTKNPKIIFYARFKIPY